MPAVHRNRSKPGDPLYEVTRAKIQTTQLIKRLSNHALGTKDDQDRLVSLDPSQVTAIKILLDKTIPNLQSIEVAGPDGDPIEIRYSKLTDDALDARLAELNEDSQD